MRVVLLLLASWAQRPPSLCGGPQSKLPLSSTPKNKKMRSTCGWRADWLDCLGWAWLGLACLALPWLAFVRSHGLFVFWEWLIFTPLIVPLVVPLVAPFIDPLIDPLIYPLIYPLMPLRAKAWKTLMISHIFSWPIKCPISRFQTRNTSCDGTCSRSWNLFMGAQMLDLQGELSPSPLRPDLPHGRGKSARSCRILAWHWAPAGIDASNSRTAPRMFFLRGFFFWWLFELWKFIFWIVEFFKFKNLKSYNL